MIDGFIAFPIACSQPKARATWPSVRLVIPNRLDQFFLRIHHNGHAVQSLAQRLPAIRIACAGARRAGSPVGIGRVGENRMRWPEPACADLQSPRTHSTNALCAAGID